MNDLFDINPKLRTANEWHSILSALVASLSSFLELEFEVTSWWIQDDRPGSASSCNCIDIKATVQSDFSLQVCGVLCLSINFGEAVWVSCDLLLFTSGHRLQGSYGKDLILLTSDRQGWHNQGWIVDENYEWKSHTDNSRWE